MAADPTQPEDVQPPRDSGHLSSAVGSVGLDWAPTNPREYTTTQHFERRAGSGDRVITHDLAAEVISRDGVPKPGNGNWYFEARSQGLDILVFCVLTGEMLPAVNTGFAHVTNPVEAYSSDRWTTRQVLCEHVRSLLYMESAPWPDPIQALSWERPIHVNAHPITSEQGENEVYCTHCERVHDTWSEMKDTFPGRE